jgi:hypothetical protein
MDTSFGVHDFFQMSQKNSLGLSSTGSNSLAFSSKRPLKQRSRNQQRHYPESKQKQQAHGPTSSSAPRNPQP